ncbi:Ger(x)C family spore germination C-terminal domain-containing protein [Paenibacillus glycanilyticus]|uniref:Ger(x)C family spore germination C-terminal domain-containing protein n=1 Tax=Paenibacillus glycanilyticus TaxID=126569 RepID=UPI001FD4C777|nr:Ger(x)C family spore germination C-terminal domain-containing protein [Paenibacillus glycanilyticus]
MIEEITPIIFWSVQEAEDGKITISTLVPPLIKEKKRVLNLKVSLINEGNKGFNLNYHNELKAGQIRLLLVDEAYAKRGLTRLINTVLTDPNISQRLYLVVTKGDFNEFLAKHLDETDNIDYYIYRMFKHYEKKKQGEITVVNLHQFMKMLYSQVSDPQLPVFRAAGDQFLYEGTAFFDQDTMVAEIRGKDDQINQLLYRDRFVRYLVLPELSVTLGHIRAHTRKKLTPDLSSLSIEIDVKGRINELDSLARIEDNYQFAALSQKIERYLEENVISLLSQMQKLQIDPLQIGALTAKPFSRPITRDTWDRHWSTMKINVKVRLHLEPLTKVK